MKKQKRSVDFQALCMTLILLFCLFPSAALAENAVTVFGTISDCGTIPTGPDGTIIQSVATQQEILGARIFGTGDYDGSVPDRTVDSSLVRLDQNHCFSNGNYIGTPLYTILAQNIAETFLESDLPLDAWQIADIAAANQIGAFGTATAYTEEGIPQEIPISIPLPEAQKQRYIDSAIAGLSGGGLSNGAFAGQVIALTALGVDARDLTTASGVKINGAAELAARAETEQSIYTLPYMLIALQPYKEAYATQIDSLVNAIAGAEYWGYGAHEADGAGPALLALSPYYRQTGYQEVTDKIDAVLAALKSNVVFDESGVVLSWGAKSTESTALLIVGLAAVGENPESFFDGANPAEGLLSMADDSGSGFVSAVYDANYQVTGYSLNAMATEQGLRGLIALVGYKNNGSACRLYDFSANDLTPGVATWFSHCPVIISVLPSGAAVTVEGHTAVYGNSFDLSAGTYSYTVSKSGYISKTGTFSVSGQDAEAHTATMISVSLVETPDTDSDCITVSFTLYGDTAHDDDLVHVFKKDKALLPIWISKTTVSVPKDASVFYLFDKVLSEKKYEYREIGGSYIYSITSPEGFCLEEGGNGANAGWLYQVNGDSTLLACRDYILSEGDRVVFFYTDDYTQETGSEQWSEDDVQKNSETPPASSDETGAASVYKDVFPGDWFHSEVCSVTERGLFQGTGDGMFHPDEAMTRAMLMAVLYRMEGSPKPVSKSLFSDVFPGDWYADAVLWGRETGIATGYSDGHFGPNDPVTRQQAALLLLRYAKYRQMDAAGRTDISCYTDADEVAEWAYGAMQWVCAEKLITGRSSATLAPDDFASRAEVAAILSRFCKKHAA